MIDIVLLSSAVVYYWWRMKRKMKEQLNAAKTEVTYLVDLVECYEKGEQTNDEQNNKRPKRV